MLCLYLHFSWSFSNVTVFDLFINLFYFKYFLSFSLLSDVTCGQVWLPILWIFALHLTHPKCTHTAVNTHTVNTHRHTHTHTHTHREHTPGAVGSIYAAVLGEQLGVRCLAQVHLSRIVKDPPPHPSHSLFKLLPSGRRYVTTSQEKTVKLWFLCNSSVLHTGERACTSHL